MFLDAGPARTPLLATCGVCRVTFVLADGGVRSLPAELLDPGADQGQFGGMCHAGCTIRVRGDLDHGNAGTLTAYDAAQFQASDYVCVDLSEADFIDAGALRAFEEIAARHNAAGGSLHIAGTRPHHRRLLRLVQMDWLVADDADVPPTWGHAARDLLDGLSGPDPESHEL